MQKFKTILMIVLVAAVIFVVGTCTFQNCRKDTSPEPPKAMYEVTIKVTGNKYYTDQLTDVGGIVTLYSYYEVVKDKYVLRDIILPLDRKIFGDIEVKTL